MGGSVGAREITEYSADVVNGVGDRDGDRPPALEGCLLPDECGHIGGG
jgi:hypothetical protein